MSQRHRNVKVQASGLQVFHQMSKMFPFPLIFVLRMQNASLVYLNRYFVYGNLPAISAAPRPFHTCFDLSLRPLSSSRNIRDTALEAAESESVADIICDGPYKKS